MTSFPILSVILFVPVAGATGAVLLPRTAGWGWALLAALVDLALSIVLITQFALGASSYQFTEHRTWLPGLGVSYALGVDGVSLFLVALNALLTVIAIAASWSVARRGDRSREYFTLMMLVSFGMMGVFLATNLLLFYVFWEVMLFPAYLLIGMFGGPRRAYAAIKFVIYTAVGSLLMLVGIIAVGALVSNTSGTPFNLDYTALAAHGVTSLPRTDQIWLFLAFASAFAIKVGLFPFHSWVPDAYSQAPVPVVVLVAGVMAKTGAYGFVRLDLGLFPAASIALTPLLSILAVIGILYFALQALVAQDFMRLLAYVSISHMSVIVLGIFALDTQGVEGAILQMVNHGIVMAALFLIAGYIERRTGSHRLADFGGLAVRLPWLAMVFLIAALSALGLPGLNSFAGEFLAFLGVFDANVVFGVLGTLVVIPAAWYMLRFFQGVTEGPETAVVEAVVGNGTGAGAAIAGAGAGADIATVREAGVAGNVGVHRTPLRDLRWGEWAVLLPLIALIFALGIVPGALTVRMEPSVLHLLPSGVSDILRSVPLPRH